MRIQFQSWFRFCLVGAIVFVPMLFYSIFGDLSKRSQLIFFLLPMPFCLFGAFMALATRVGWVEMVYSEKDRRTMFYRMAEQVAVNEHGKALPFSEKYYGSFGLNKPRSGSF